METNTKRKNNRQKKARKNYKARKKQSDKIAHVHDRFYHNVLMNICIARMFLQIYLPKSIVHYIDWDTLQIIDPTHTSNDLRSKNCCDILYMAKFKGHRGEIYILIEHQSTEKKMMSYRVGKYLINITENHLKTNENSEKRKQPLPFIVPIVFYTGRKPYSRSNDVCDLVYAPRALMKNYSLPTFLLVDLNTVDDAEIIQHKQLGLFEYTMKYYANNDHRDKDSGLLQLMREVAKLGEHNLITACVSYILNNIDRDDANNFIAAATAAVNHSKAEKNIMTIAQRLRNEGKIEGEKRGIIKGEKRGIVKGEKLGMFKVARRLLQTNADLAYVAKMTKLPLTIIKQLQAEQSHSA